MTTEVLTLPVFRAFDSSGAPLAGGLLYTYAAGTTTPLATYQDGAGAVPNTNPVVLDSSGTATVRLSAAAYKLVLKDSSGSTTIWTVDNYSVPNAGSVTDAMLASSSTVSAIVTTYARTAAEISAGVTPTNYGYPPGDVRRYGADPTGVADSTTAIQNAINVGQPVYLPTGTYKITSTLNFPNTVSVLRGDGPESSIISCNGVAGSVLKPAAITYFRPVWSDFYISGNSSTGIGIDFSAVTGQVYDGNLSRIRISVGGDGIYAPHFFSMKVDSVFSTSTSGHCFRIACGPAVTFLNCYAIACGSGKAGYRLIGGVNMVGCNGVDSCDYWGVFGQDTAATDGFQNDFPTGADYPSVNLVSCNIEAFSVCGIYVHSPFREFNVQGGKIDRASLSTTYKSLVYFRSTPVFSTSNGVSAAVFNIGVIFQGSGTPDGGVSATNAYIYVAASSDVMVVDMSGALAALPGVLMGVYGNNLVPVIKNYVQHDVYQDAAQFISALTARRFSAQMVRYVTPSALTPVGAGQAINVTGYTKVTVTPAAAASISTATFTATPGTGSDYGRNGDLIIEAGNANLTVNHSASGANTFRMAGGANVTMTAGQILRFCYSTTSSQWIQV